MRIGLVLHTAYLWSARAEDAVHVHSVSDRAAYAALSRLAAKLADSDGKITGRKAGRAMPGSCCSYAWVPCNVIQFGHSSVLHPGMAHLLCENLLPSPPVDCNILTYGIQNDYSFEVGVQNRTGCRVHGCDPTVNHAAELAPSVHFLKFAGPSTRPAAAWKTVGPALLAQAVARQPARISVLKMDCEGCEYALYADILDSPEPNLFSRVDQFNLEYHPPVVLGKARVDEYIAHMLNYGRLLILLERAGLSLKQTFSIQAGPLCSSDPGPAVRNATGYWEGRGKSYYCENLLFARDLPT